MTFETVLSILGLIVATVAAIAGVAALITTIAGLPEEGRERLARWSRALAGGAARLLHFLYSLVALVNGSLGVALFAFDPAPISRAAVLQLVLFLLNVAIGMYSFDKLADIRAAQRTPKMADAESRYNK